MGRFFLFLFLATSLSMCSSKPSYPPPPVVGGRIVIPIKDIPDAKPVFYSIKVDGKRVDFFVLRIGDSVESYLDACRQCYPQKMGFRNEGFYIVCRYCGVRYPLDRLKTGIGSCYPIQLQGKIEGDSYIIEIGRLRKAKKFF